MPGITLKLDGLDKLLKALKAKPPVARIGILGESSREGGGPTNADIGAIHEFGGAKTPMRSFLRMPLTEELPAALEASGAFDEETLKQVIKTGTVVPWVQKVMIVAEGVVGEAFATGGFGKWPPSNMAGKKNAQTLVETGQLRDSITSEVK